jgi:membrane associated rhomboid family serine protease
MNLNLPPVVKNLLFINIGVYILAIFAPAMMDTFVLYPLPSPEFRPWQIVTHMFMHASLHDQNIGIFHIFFNMFALVSFGRLLETFWGPKKFLLFYMVCGIGAAFIHSGVTFIELEHLQKITDAYLFNPDPLSFNSYVHEYYRAGHSQNLDFIEAFRLNPENINYINDSKTYVNQIYLSHLNSGAVGASGAITGLLVAVAMLFPNTELMIMFIPVPVKAKYFVMGYVGVELFLGISQFEGDTIAHFAHLGGALFGYILIKYWQRQRTDFY